jgi:hypothetical protein
MTGMHIRRVLVQAGDGRQRHSGVRHNRSRQKTRNSKARLISKMIPQCHDCRTEQGCANAPFARRRSPSEGNPPLPHDRDAHHRSPSEGNPPSVHRSPSEGNPPSCDPPSDGNLQVPLTGTQGRRRKVQEVDDIVRAALKAVRPGDLEADDFRHVAVVADEMFRPCRGDAIAR